MDAPEDWVNDLIDKLRAHADAKAIEERIRGSR